MKSIFQSMTSRVFFILFGGILVAMLLTIGLALGERQRMIGEFRDYHAVERVAQFIESLETVQPELRAPFLAAASGIGMHAELAGTEDSAMEQRSSLAAMLGRRMGEAHRVVSTPTRASDCPAFRPRPQSRKAAERRTTCEALLITLGDGERLRLSLLPPRPPPSPLRPEYWTYAAIFLLSIAALAAIIARMTMRPLKQLAQAATALGNNIERPPLPERGAIEIRQAAAAFNAMQSRIRHHIQQRAHILAAITHDLQTPMTRLRLRLEKVDDLELKDKLVGDLSAMQGMVKEGLDLARSMDSAEPMQPLDLDSLIDSVCTDAIDAGQSVTTSGQIHASLRARPLALRRCLTNLIDNAVKYGQSAHVSAARDGAFAVIRIRDDGPGIPEDELDKVFEPFYRLENSRSRQTGGTGLGLTIASNIAEQHGGRIRLANPRGGGLEVTLELPLPALKS
ncbi:HAMP domain-containing protein [Noviherbaspirillum cavernae]|uniref:histidine kinase n=1 Tax=Noviherbaspirillum cavernae TaxID=2320862 RepID=A0A418X0V7_9BURK|nr:ATP-binding protein [Noviherbaspirillum cavernae]RJG06126.1 HAMP domain-containing protein [Noviherbaspirillum cavernae]